MPVYSVEGKLGTGKTLFCVWRAQEALLEGRRVASNVDFDLAKLAPRARSNYVRLPDKPTPFDLDAIGHGNPDSYDEDRNGVLILDELGTWLNARTFQDKSRAGVLDWLIHARKLGWDVYLIVQDANMIDKQVRESLIELQVRCMRGDKIRIPVVGGFLASIYKPLGYLPRFHWATARIGYGANSVIAERWYYKGTNLYAAYDTRQVFKADYPHGAHCVLPPDIPPVRPGLLRRWLGALGAIVGLRVGSKRPALGKARPLPKPRAIELISRLPDPDERVRLLRRWLMQSQLRTLNAAFYGTGPVSPAHLDFRHKDGCFNHPTWHA